MTRLLYTMRLKMLLFLLALLPLTVVAQETLAGEWMLIASNNGVEVAPGIYRAGTDTIRFTAAPSADGTLLECHTDSLYWRSGTPYPADWRICVEYDSEGRHRIGWVLDSEQPASTKEFIEPKEKYLENGFFYWGNDDGGHRYIYLLSENVDASAIIGMTFWSGWGTSATTEYSLSNTEHNSQKVYAVVASAIPYGGSVGWIEIWGNPRMVKASTDTGISHLRHDEPPSATYDITGRRIASGNMHTFPAGIYISNGKKLLVRTRH